MAVIEWFQPQHRAYEWFGPTGEILASIQGGGVSVVASVIGPPGPRGLAGGEASTFTYTQDAPAMVWTIDHNLGHEPLISITDAAGDEVECTVRNPTVNRTTATFSEAISGRARLY